MSNFYCDGKVIRDNLGRQRIFRGINICLKNKPLSIKQFEKNLCSQEYIDMLKNNGFNIIRLGITWEFIEPVENEYSLKYIDVYKKFVSLCQQNDIYIILDMHQDLFSRYLCGVGDGTPKWALSPDVKRSKTLAIWAEGYFYMDNVQQSFYDFWTNKNAIQDKFCKMWQFFARQFAEYNNVIAYDYLNEPFVHTYGRKIFLTLVEKIIKLCFNKQLNLGKKFVNCSNKFGFVKTILAIAGVVKTLSRLKKMAKVMDNKDNFNAVINGLEQYTNDFNSQYYQPFYNSMSNELNADGQKFNLLEHNYYSNLGVPFAIECNQNSVYSPHAYDIFVDSPLYNKYSSDNRICAIIDSIKANQDKMNVPVIFGEWGGGAQGTTWIKHIDYVMSLMEQNQWSNIYWGFERDNKALVDVINRPYPVAINGDIISIHTDSKSREFTLKWQQSNTDAENLIYVPNKGVIYVKGQTGENTFIIKY